MHPPVLQSPISPPPPSQKFWGTQTSIYIYMYRRAHEPSVSETLARCTVHIQANDNDHTRKRCLCLSSQTSSRILLPTAHHYTQRAHSWWRDKCYIHLVCTYHERYLRKIQVRSSDAHELLRVRLIALSELEKPFQSANKYTLSTDMYSTQITSGY